MRISLAKFPLGLSVPAVFLVSLWFVSGMWTFSKIQVMFREGVANSLAFLAKDIAKMGVGPIWDTVGGHCHSLRGAQPLPEVIPVPTLHSADYQGQHLPWLHFLGLRFVIVAWRVLKHLADEAFSLLPTWASGGSCQTLAPPVDGLLQFHTLLCWAHLCPLPSGANFPKLCVPLLEGCFCKVDDPSETIVFTLFHLGGAVTWL